VAIEDRFINELPTQMKKGLDQSMTRMIKTLDSDVPQKGLVKRL
jgi:hypothetical protein